MAETGSKLMSTMRFISASIFLLTLSDGLCSQISASRSTVHEQVLQQAILEKIKPCAGSPESFRKNAFVIYPSSEGRVSKALGGWSHINEHPKEFGALQYAVDDSRYSASGKIVPVDKCPDMHAHKMILVKKIANWDRQHSNGLEASLENELKTFDHIYSVTLEIKVHTQDTVLPNHARLQEILGARLTANQYRQLDSGTFVLSLSMLGKRSESGDTDAGLLHFIEIKKSDFDQWLRITLPVGTMIPFSEIKYKKDAQAFSKIMNNKVYHLQLTAETFGDRRAYQNLGTFGHTARNFLGDKWSKSQAEVFKELGLSIRYLSVNWQR